jgi:hypothetical protein
MLNFEASQLAPLVAKQGWSSGGDMVRVETKSCRSMSKKRER